MSGVGWIVWALLLAAAVLDVRRGRIPAALGVGGVLLGALEAARHDLWQGWLIGALPALTWITRRPEALLAFVGWPAAWPLLPPALLNARRRIGDGDLAMLAMVAGGCGGAAAALAGIGMGLGALAGRRLLPGAFLGLSLWMALRLWGG
jgi:hypothetical protein